MLKLYNTLTGNKEDFVPLAEGKAGMYACGVTVYDHSHLGHARGAVVFDVIRNYLRHKGYDVKYVRNFTDIDDKIIKRAAETGVTWKELAERYTGEYIKDMAALGVGRPDLEPKATEHIPEIIETVKRLVERGYAYESGGDVFFSVRKFTGYGRLSKKPLDEMESGARVEVNEQKDDPLDFALWKASRQGEPAWDSPWGPGRPGWHIECSAMSIKHLGETFDIHCGGMDLQFPHHENEIAQAEAATGKPFVKYWLHNGFVNVNREKMSKSLGNFFTIKEILAAYEPEAIRLFLLSTHYRHPIDFSDQSLKDAKAALDRFYNMKQALDEALAGHTPSDYDPAVLSGDASGLHMKMLAFEEKFTEAMDDDFNTAAVVGSIFELVRDINKVVADKALIKEDPHIKDVLSRARDALGEISGVLNLFAKKPGEWLQRVGITGAGGITLPLFTVSGSGDSYTKKGIDALIDERNAARASRDWKRADEIRDELLEAGIELLDGPEGTKWRTK